MTINREAGADMHKIFGVEDAKESKAVGEIRHLLR